LKVNHPNVNDPNVNDLNDSNAERLERPNAPNV